MFARFPVQMLRHFSLPSVGKFHQKIHLKSMVLKMSFHFCLYLMGGQRNIHNLGINVVRQVTRYAAAYLNQGSLLQEPCSVISVAVNLDFVSIVVVFYAMTAVFVDTAHMDCSLRSYMAGTVGGIIGLDAEYYCRRCDARTDLLSHVIKLLQTYETIGSHDDVEKILKLGVRVLRGSQRTSAKRLLHHIELAMEKLKNGTELEDIWKVDDSSAVTPGMVTCYGNNALESAKDEEPVDIRPGSPQKVSENFDPQIESLKLENEVDQILQSLRTSQELEYNIAQERLYEQKKYLQNLYQHLKKEHCDLARHTAYVADPDALLQLIVDRVDQIKREVIKLKDMGVVAKGFGKTSKEISKEHFDIEI